MTKIERFILKQLSNRKYLITLHARQRMSERFISDADIAEASQNLISFEYQGKNNTYLLKGYDSWEEVLVISIAVRENIIIVTVFHEDFT